MVNEIDRWILQAIALTEDRGIYEAALEKLAAVYSPDVVPHVEEALDRFEQRDWITTRWEVLTGDAKATKIRHCTITATGRTTLEKSV